MSYRRRSRRLVGAALLLQLAALVWKGLWHGFLNPEFEFAATYEQMVRHLSTVHIPFYLGVLALLLATGRAVVEELRRGERGLLMPMAFVGACAPSPVQDAR